MLYKKVLEGTLERNPHGDWSDVDRGLYIDGDRISDILDEVEIEYEGKKVRMMI